jgi:hypothetical protein
VSRREPTAEARQLARTIRDHVDAMTAENFTEDQALRFLATWASNVRNDPPENPNP